MLLLQRLQQDFSASSMASLLWHKVAAISGTLMRFTEDVERVVNTCSSMGVAYRVHLCFVWDVVVNVMGFDYWGVSEIYR